MNKQLYPLKLYQDSNSKKKHGKALICNMNMNMKQNKFNLHFVDSMYQTLGNKLPIIIVPDFTNEIGLTVQFSWNTLHMQIYMLC